MHYGCGFQGYQNKQLKQPQDDSKEAASYHSGRLVPRGGLVISCQVRFTCRPRGFHYSVRGIAVKGWVKHQCRLLRLLFLPMVFGNADYGVILEWFYNSPAVDGQAAHRVRFHS